MSSFASPRRTPMVSEGQGRVRPARYEQQSNTSLTAVLRSAEGRITGFVSRVNVRTAFD
jgi:hypothetical protein